MDLVTLSIWLNKITQQNYLSGIKAAIGIAACLLIFYESQAERPITPRVKQIVGSILAVAAIASFFQFFHLSYKEYYHRWELFHYYMGSKYAKELSYERIYVCTAIADAESGNEKVVKHRKLRDLRVNLLVPSTQALAKPEENCKAAFTPERWADFKKNMLWFRKAAGDGAWWNDMQKDHGYNPPPGWTILGHYLSILADAGDAFFKALAAIDVTLTALMFLALGWAFGWRITLVAAIFWGVQEPAPFYWTGGAFLRQDWFFLSVLSACLARKKYYFWSGVALTYAGMLRVFPVLLWAGPMILLAADVYRHRRLQPKFLRMFGGGALALALLLPISLHVSGGWPAYKEFAHHISVHNNTPLTNHMGLKTIVATAPDGRMKFTRDNRLLDPFERWKELRRSRYHSLRVVYYGVIAAFVAGLVWAVWKLRSIWVAQALSLILVVSLVEATCYYYSIWILAALLTRLKPSMGPALASVFYGMLIFLGTLVTSRVLKTSELVGLLVTVGVAAVIHHFYAQSIEAFARSRGSMEIAVIGLGAMTQLLTLQFYFIDDKFTVLSVLYVAFTAAMLFGFLRKPEIKLGAEALPVRTSMPG